MAAEVIPVLTSQLAATFWNCELKRTSLTHPLQIAVVTAGPEFGRVGITFCPGKYDQHAMSGCWDRDLALDLDTVRDWGAARQGISRAGSGHARAVMIETAWLWIKHQPKSALTRWFVERTAGQSKRVRKIMIVAVARKLAIALWRYVELGLVPQGAIINSPMTRKARS
jgi:hypothetical protein